MHTAASDFVIFDQPIANKFFYDDAAFVNGKVKQFIMQNY